MGWLKRRTSQALRWIGGCGWEKGEAGYVEDYSVHYSVLLLDRMGCDWMKKANVAVALAARGVLV